MDSYNALCEAFDQKNVLKENLDAVTGGAIGGTISAGVGAAMIGVNEWFLHWVKELKSVTLYSRTPQQVKNWYNKNIVDDDALFWTRKANLKWDYFSIPIAMYAKKNDPDYKSKIIARCNKFIYLTRICGGVIAAFSTLEGIGFGTAFGSM